MEENKPDLSALVEAGGGTLALADGRKVRMKIVPDPETDGQAVILELLTEMAGKWMRTRTASLWDIDSLEYGYLAEVVRDLWAELDGAPTEGDLVENLYRAVAEMRRRWQSGESGGTRDPVLWALIVEMVRPKVTVTLTPAVLELVDGMRRAIYYTRGADPESQATRTFRQSRYAGALKVLAAMTGRSEEALREEFDDRLYAYVESL